MPIARTTRTVLTVLLVVFAVMIGLWVFGLIVYYVAF